jgi:UDP-3-O-[3-hydroxymyristoyl] glucosamine N-acyltransferase
MRKLTHSISSRLLANELCLEHFGNNIDITNINTLSNSDLGSLTFSTTPLIIKNKGFVVTTIADKCHSGLISTNPRLDFIRIINWLSNNNFISDLDKGVIHPSAIIHPTAIVDKCTSIGSNSVIGPNCSLTNGVLLGSNVKVGINTVIGHDGFGYEKDNNGIPIHFPHLGRVIINNNVTIGNLCTLARGTIRDTVINSNVKIDDHTYIAHNVLVGSNTLLMSGSKINGSVKIGHDCWLGTGAMIKEHVEVGNGVLIGMGSVVIDDVKSNLTIAGNPSKIIKQDE